MKTFYLFLITQFLFAVSVTAKSYNTITIDGNNTGWASDEQFTNCSAADNAYFTWDQDYIYIGISDAEADYDNVATFVYIDSDPMGTNGSANAYAWGDNITTPFNADYVIVFKNGLNNPSDYIQVMHFNNTTSIWEEIYTNTGSLFVLSATNDTVVKFNVGVDYRELKINRTYIGSPDEIKTCMFTEQQWDSYWRYFVWPSNDWTDASRASGQSIPHYYGFFLESGISPNRAPYFDASFNEWSGAARSTSWFNAGNWQNGLPDANTLVKLPSSANVIVDAAGALSDDILMKVGAVLTVNTDGTLTSNGGIYNYTGSSGIIVESSATANGSLINYGYGNTSMTVQCYTTAGQWHSFAAPVSGLTSNDLYLNASPEVWLTEYNEPTRDYTYITTFTEPLGDVKGWMLWVGGSGSHTYDFAGVARESTQGTDNNASRSAAGIDYGFTYVGNPFSSAIDWDAASGWTKTNLNNAIYIRNGSSWASYVAGVGTPIGVGTRYIAMNQGFFVQVTDGAGTYPEYGTVKMSRSVCVHNSVGFLKSTTVVDSLIRLQLDHFGISDETVIRFVSEATEEFDGQYDAGKMSSYSDNRPLIYSTSMGNSFSINSLPLSVQEVRVSATGIHGIDMTISAIEINSFTDVYLSDELTGIITNLSTDSYTFECDSNYIDRFKIYFTITDINNLQDNDSELFTAYSSKNSIIIQVDNSKNYNLLVTNLFGQRIFSEHSNKSQQSIPISSSGVYLITIQSGNNIQTKKVFVN